jgi:Protein of unknown function (DUF2924)
MSAIIMTDKLRWEVEALDHLTREELVERWRKAHGCPPPSGVRRDLLIRSAAWHLQRRRVGDFPAGTRRQLKEAICRVEAGMVRKTGNQHASEDLSPNVTGQDSKSTFSGKTRRSLPPGARLLREWNGRTHVVDVIENGFVFEGTVFRSLSAIARRITGTTSPDA